MKFPSRPLGVLAVAATLTLAGCADGGAEDNVMPTDTATPVTAPTATPIQKYTPTPTPTPKDDDKRSPRGNLIMSVGDIGEISQKSTGNVHVKFKVDSMAGVTCTGPSAEPSENGTVIAIGITVETTPELSERSYPKFTLSGYDFKFIADNGTTFNGNLATRATYGCIPDSETFPSAGMGPAEKVNAKVLLDVPAPTGTLVLSFAVLNGGGFEYRY